jgi:hypothetical protein
VALAECAVVWAARGIDKVYLADPYWLVAAYAEPWRTAAVSVVVDLSLAVSVSAARARYLSWPEFLAAAAALASSIAICLELTTAVHFNDALGELYLHTFVFRRAKVSFEKGDSAWCLRAELGNPFVWRLYGTSIHPRLLPLPYESSAVVGRLLRPSPGCPPRP